MLPTAGLYLPQTLHRSDESTSYLRETEGAGLKYLQRRPRRPKREEIEVGSQSSLSLTTTISKDHDDLSSVETAFSFADFVSSLSKKPTETELFVNLIHHARRDDAEASRLYGSPAVLKFLDIYPDQKTEIETTRLDLRRTLNEIGVYVEGVRISGDDGGPSGQKRRFEWVSNHQKKLQGRHQLLTTCHNRLMTIIRVMQTVEQCGGVGQDQIYEAPVEQDQIFEAPVLPWIKNKRRDHPRSPYSRRPGKRNVSITSFATSETDQDDMDANSGYSTPVELPGSTPDDLLNLSNSVSNISVELGTPHNDQTTRNASVDTLNGQHAALRHMDASALTQSSLPSLEHTRPQDNNMPIQHVGPGVSQMQTQQPQAMASNTYRRSYPDHTQKPTPSSHKPCTSLDATYRLPTVSEKTVERNDSATSTKETVPAPVRRPKRYRRQPVDLRKANIERWSLNSELPFLQSQPSLADDLAPWISPKEMSDKNPMAISYSPTSTIPTQMTTQSFHDFRDKTLSSNPGLAMALSKTNLDDLKRTTSLQTPSSTLPRKPLPTSMAEMSRRASAPATWSKPAFPPPSDPPPGSDVKQGPLAFHSEQNLPTSSPTPPSTAIPGDPASSDDVPGAAPGDYELTLLQQKLLKQDYVYTAQADLPPALPIDKDNPINNPEPLNHAPIVNSSTPTSPQESTTQHPPQIKVSDPLVPPLVPSVSDSAHAFSPPVEPPLLTAQAKRRAAHARRMQRVFG